MLFPKAKKGIETVTSVIVIMIIVLVLLVISFTWLGMDEVLANMLGNSGDKINASAELENEYTIESAGHQIFYVYDKVDLFAKTPTGKYVSGIDNIQVSVKGDNDKYSLVDVLEFGDYYDKMNIIILVENGLPESVITDAINYVKTKQEDLKKVNVAIYQFNDSVHEVVGMTDSLKTYSFSSLASSEVYLYDSILEAINILATNSAFDSDVNEIIIFSSGACTETNIFDLDINGNPIDLDCAGARNKMNGILTTLDNNINIISPNCNDMDIRRLAYEECSSDFNDFVDNLDDSYMELNKFYVTFEHEPGDLEHEANIKVYRNDMSGNLTLMLS